MVVPANRTLLVLTVLVGAMTVASVLLLAAEPGPTSHTPAMVAFRSLDGIARQTDLLADTAAPLRPWNAIAIHFSGAPYGSAQTLDQTHRHQNLGPLAFHFVLGNGLGAEDGQLQVGLRWTQQQPGLTSLLRPEPANQGIIDICLIGDGLRSAPTDKQMAQLVTLVHQLQKRTGIPAQRVMLYTDPATGRGRLFPVARFRQQLYTFAQN